MGQKPRVAELGPSDVFAVGGKWFGICVRGHELIGCDTVRVRTHPARAGGDLGLTIPPEDFGFSEELSFRFPHCPDRISFQSSSRGPKDKLGVKDIICFDIDIHDVEDEKFDGVEFLLIKCDTLEVKQIQGFENGCL